MTVYRYEYGKRWDARIPRSQIGRMIDRLHVSASDDDITAELAPGIDGCVRDNGLKPKTANAFRRQCIAYAIERHRRNRELFSHVMRGR